MRSGSTQAQRRARSRRALLASAARGLARHGYANLALEQVAREAGYTRGALYHQFAGKQELTLAVIEWLLDAWNEEVAPLVEQETSALAALLALARGHAVFCRGGTARIGVTLRLEFAEQDHPVARAVEHAYDELLETCLTLITAGRAEATIPPGPPAKTVALAYIGALEGAVIALADHAPHDETFAARSVAGILGIEPQALTAG